MLQRKQSIYLALAAILNLVALFVPAWRYHVGTDSESIQGFSIQAQGSMGALAPHSFMEHPFHIIWTVLSLLAAGWLAYVIFQYENRPKQIKFAFIGMFLTMIATAALCSLTLNGPYYINGGADHGSPWIGIICMLFSILFAWLGIKGIRADEALVRSVDRIR